MIGAVLLMVGGVIWSRPTNRTYNLDLHLDVGRTYTILALFRVIVGPTYTTYTTYIENVADNNGSQSDVMHADGCT